MGQLAATLASFLPLGSGGNLRSEKGRASQDMQRAECRECIASFRLPGAGSLNNNPQPDEDL